MLPIDYELLIITVRLSIIQVDCELVMSVVQMELSNGQVAFAVVFVSLLDMLVAMVYYNKGECSVFLKKYILWMKTIHYSYTLRSHLVTIILMAPFTLKSTSKLRSALHFSYSIVIRRFYSALILRNPNNHYNYGFPNTLDDNHYVYSDYLVCSVTAIAHIIRY